MLTQKQKMNKELLFLFAILIFTLFFSTFGQRAFSNEVDIYIESMDLVGDYNAYQRKWMNEAWEMTHDKEFMYMMKAENGKLNHDRQSEVVKYVTRYDENDEPYQVAIREPSFGFCQMHRKHHPEIVNDPRFFSDPLWQLEQCYRLYKGGTKFYAVDRMRNDANFKSQVESSFIFF